MNNGDDLLVNVRWHRCARSSKGKETLKVLINFSLPPSFSLSLAVSLSLSYDLIRSCAFLDCLMGIIVSYTCYRILSKLLDGPNSLLEKNSNSLLKYADVA